jgi:hypothetical protein
MNFFQAFIHRMFTSAIRQAGIWAMSAIVKIFGCRPHANDAARAAGRRTKISKGGNRGKRYGGALYTEARGPKSG